MTSPAELIAFTLLAAFTVVTAIAAVSLRNLVHCALALALAYTGFAGLFILLGAEFVGFIQLLVYVGAVAVLIMFVILLTRPDGHTGPARLAKLMTALPGLVVAAATFTVLAMAICTSPSLDRGAVAATTAPIQTIGELLLSDYLLPLQLIGVLLTAALIGAASLAQNDTPPTTAGSGRH